VAPKEVAVPPGVTVLAAATGQETSLGFPEARHGLFTYFVLKGLKGEAGRGNRLSHRDLFDYVTANVPERARWSGRKQTPVLIGAPARDNLLAP
jgi:hypothetical protein